VYTVYEGFNKLENGVLKMFILKSLETFFNIRSDIFESAIHQENSQVLFYHSMTFALERINNIILNENLFKR